MAARALASNHDRGGDDDDLPWVDYQSGQRPPDSVEYLRIGMREARQHDGTMVRLQTRIFKAHPSLKRVKIHVGLLSEIPRFAFRKCVQLETVEFVAWIRDRNSNNDDTVSHLSVIGKGAFDDCQRLREVIGLENLASSLERIELFAFYNCFTLTSVDLSQLRKLEFLGPAAFGRCHSLKSVDFSTVSLCAINTLTFYECEALTSIHLPPFLAHLGRGAFYHCHKLSNVHLPHTLHRIYGSCFRYCYSLETLSIPSSVQRIDPCAFHHCGALSKITFEHSLFDSLEALRQRRKWWVYNGKQFKNCHESLTIEWSSHASQRDFTPKLWAWFLAHVLSRNEDILEGTSYGNPSIAFYFLRQNVDFLLQQNPIAKKRKYS